jgi:hypothetical protein
VKSFYVARKSAKKSSSHTETREQRKKFQAKTFPIILLRDEEGRKSDTRARSLSDAALMEINFEDCVTGMASRCINEIKLKLITEKYEIFDELECCANFFLCHALAGGRNGHDVSA